MSVRELVNEVVNKLREYTEERHLHGQIYGRPKHIYSIYRKMHDKRKRFDELYDLIFVVSWILKVMFMRC